MKDEIKEILDELKNKDNYIEDYGFRYKRIALDDVWYLLDYITNLQKENERLKETQYVWSYDLDMQLEDYKSRIEKAIEYIMTELITEWNIKNGDCVSGSDLPVDAIIPLLNILQGLDK